MAWSASDWIFALTAWAIAVALYPAHLPSASVAVTATRLVSVAHSALTDPASVPDADRVESYRYDRAMFCPAGMPAAVVLAQETAHVQRASASEVIGADW